MVILTDRIALLRFLTKIQFNGDGCWLWMDGLNNGGYGSFDKTTAHRFIYEYFYGPIENDNDIDHRCRTRSCVNPMHLESVTRRENILRGVAIKSGLICKNGHVRTPENTRIWASGRKENGIRGRYCLDCRRMKSGAIHAD